MNIIELYLNERFLFNDKTISIDLDKFESGEIPRLLIVGYSGSGKTTLGKILSKKYKKELRNLDGCEKFVHDRYKKEEFKKRFIECIRDSIKQKGIIEGIQIVDVKEYNLDKNFLMKQPVIIIGTSLIISSIRSGIRNENIKDISFFLWSQYNTNFKLVRKKLNNFRKERMNIKGANIKEFKI